MRRDGDPPGAITHLQDMELNMDRRIAAATVGLALVGGAWFLGGCAASGGRDPAMKISDEAGELTPEEAKAAAELAASNEPLKGDGAVLWVHGLSCPLCSSNIDTVLKRVEGVTSVRVDLAAGTVRLGLAGPNRPSRRDLWKAVDSSGFTLVRVDAE